MSVEKWGATEVLANGRGARARWRDMPMLVTLRKFAREDSARLLTFLLEHHQVLVMLDGLACSCRW